MRDTSATAAIQYEGIKSKTRHEHEAAGSGKQGNVDLCLLHSANVT